MSGELDAAGALATAGLAAGAIEGQEPGPPGEGPCLNCGAQLSGSFCSNCGQAARPHRSLVHVIEEFLHGLFHFDTKAWRTLPMLIGRPGTLTRNFVYGKRARYVSPLATFLLCVFLMFFVFAFLPGPDFDGMATTREEAVGNLEEARAAVREAERELAAAIASPDEDQPAGLEERLARQAVRLAQAEVERREAAIARIDAIAAREAEQQAEASQARAESPPAAEADPAPPEPVAAQAEGPSTRGPSVGVAASDDVTIGGEGRWQDQVRDAVDRGDITVNLGNEWLEANVLESLRNPDLALFKIQEAAYKFSFLLVPMSLPFLFLMFFWKRGVTFYDHVVYALYALSFAALLFIAVVLTAPWAGWLGSLLVVVGLPVHTFFHLGGSYALGWFSALWRTLFMLIFAIVIASFYLSLIVILGLAG